MINNEKIKWFLLYMKINSSLLPPGSRNSVIVNIDLVTIQVEESDRVREVSETGSDVREDRTSGDPDQWRLGGRVELQGGERHSEWRRGEREVQVQVCRVLSHLRPLLPRQEQVRTALVPVCSGSGSVPPELDLELPDQTGLQTQLLQGQQIILLYNTQYFIIYIITYFMYIQNIIISIYGFISIIIRIIFFHFFHFDSVRKLFSFF